MVQSYQDLDVWKKSMDLVVLCYEVTRQFPDDEKFGLVSQIRRASTSIPANIAEGHGRGTPKSFVNFLWISNGSLRELETHVLIASRLGYVGESVKKDVIERTNEIGKMLNGLRRSIESRT